MSGHRIITTTERAAGDLTNHQHHIARATGAGLCNFASHAAAATGTMIGVFQNNPASGQAAAICRLGETWVVAGGALTVNAYITTNGSGRAAAAASGDLCIGQALQAAGADGDSIRALVWPPVPLLRT